MISPSTTAPKMPLTGPDSTKAMGLALAAATVAMPPFDCMMNGDRPMPLAAISASRRSR